ncbi:MAG: hypothetical protein JO043_12130 [Candidatus Eremiobacteraeota bacterium]|nr:hypothetical protein [Candidatus Eremiobacteraeota bacterium]
MACVLASFFFVLALSQQVYDVTSPASWSWHVAVRKLYSIGAFTLVGYALRRALWERGIRYAPWLTALLVGGYSALIEVAQAAMGSREGFAWNAVDIACGAVGGFLAEALARWRL